MRPIIFFLFLLLFISSSFYKEAKSVIFTLLHKILQNEHFRPICGGAISSLFVIKSATSYLQLKPLARFYAGFGGL